MAENEISSHTIRLDTLRLSAKTGCPIELIYPIIYYEENGYRLYNVLGGNNAGAYRVGPGPTHEVVEKVDLADYSPRLRLVREMDCRQTELFDDEKRKAA